jgi:putative membrane protein
MAAPLLLAGAAPMTLALRALPTARARRVVRLLKRRPIRLLIHPATAALLDMGGLWLLYTTPLYGAMHAHRSLELLIHAHLLVAGYLFTATMIGIDPIRNRPSWTTRAVVLVAALAAHAILAKYLYLHPPVGVPASQARRASLLMYYGGDLADGVLITLFCRQWYRASRPRPKPVAAVGLTHIPAQTSR